MPPTYVKAYVERNRHDVADAEAICEAVRRPSKHLGSSSSFLRGDGPTIKMPHVYRRCAPLMPQSRLASEISPHAQENRTTRYI
jgi:hypothetical protein